MTYIVDLDDLSVEQTALTNTSMSLELLSVPSDLSLTGVQVVYRPISGGAWSTALFSALTIGTTLLISGLSSGTRYEYFVQALSATDESFPTGYTIVVTPSSVTPSVEPVDKRILDNIVSTLEGIVQGSEYWGQFTKVTTDLGNTYDQLEKPCAIVYMDETEEKVITQNLSQMVVLNIVIEVHFYVDSNLERACRRWIHDVKKALGQDDTVGGLAVNSEVIATAPLHNAENPNHGVVLVFLQVVYRHNRLDPSQVRC